MRGGSPYRLSPPERKKMETQCSKGWADRCAHSKSKKCQCGCGGMNHGKNFHGMGDSQTGNPMAIPVIGEKAIREKGSAGLIVGEAESRAVFIDGVYLTPHRSQELRNHSPNGFCWGYGGSGPSQLALAILLEFADELTALDNYQIFKWEIIAKLPMDENFSFPMSKVKDWLNGRQKNEERI